MGSEPTSSISTTSQRDVDLYHTLGGMDACHRLAVAFYTRVEHDPILRPLFPSTHLLKGCPVKNLASFLAQFLGGPCEYVRWSLSLREAHFRFKIGQKERDAWLNTMFHAIDDVALEEPARSALRWFFEQSSAYLINQPPSATVAPSLASEHAEEEQSKLEASPVNQDMLQKWEMQRILEEIVATVRLSNVDHALMLLETPQMQSYFERDSAALLSLLAIFSESGHPVLLDYVCQKLVYSPELVRGHCTRGGTLLYEVAGQGSLTIVKLLLELGADPNATDRGGHTPLYCVGNRCSSKEAGDIVRVLVQAGADVNAQDQVMRCTPLHMAARRCNILVAEALLDCGADLEARDRTGVTPLRRAVNCRKAEMVAYLLSRGATAHAKENRS